MARAEGAAAPAALLFAQLRALPARGWRVCALGFADRLPARAEFWAVTHPALSGRRGLVRGAGRGGVGRERRGLLGAGVSAHPPPSKAPLCRRTRLWARVCFAGTGKQGRGSSWSPWGWGVTVHSRADELQTGGRGPLSSVRPSVPDGRGHILAALRWWGAR